MVEESRPKSPKSSLKPLNSQERARNGAIFFARNIVCGIKADALPCTSEHVPDDFISGLLVQDMDEVAQQFIVDLGADETNRILNAPIPADNEPNIFGENPEQINLLLYAQKRFGKYSAEYAKTKELFRKFYKKTGDDAWSNAIVDVDALPDTGFSLAKIPAGFNNIKQAKMACTSAIVEEDGTVKIFNGNTQNSDNYYVNFRQLCQLPNLTMITIQNQCALNSGEELVELVKRNTRLKKITISGVNLTSGSAIGKPEADGRVSYTLIKGPLTAKNGELVQLRRKDVARIEASRHDGSLKVTLDYFTVDGVVQLMPIDEDEPDAERETIVVSFPDDGSAMTVEVPPVPAAK
jgi:hypothetical protein